MHLPNILRACSVPTHERTQGVLSSALAWVTEENRQCGDQCISNVKARIAICLVNLLVPMWFVVFGTLGPQSPESA